MTTEMKSAFVLGIDGLPYTLAKRLIADGVMPNLGKLAASRGALAQMHTTIPDFSCTAWTSFATGVNPGKHGMVFMAFRIFIPRTGIAGYQRRPLARRFRCGTPLATRAVGRWCLTCRRPTRRFRCVAKWSRGLLRQTSTSRSTPPPEFADTLCGIKVTDLFKGG